ncbi:polyprenyl synthetase family protein [Rhodohalobacter sp.]|uniref:polyprenyl synthetase family protein n=1 Tax=Rhodohalobacter sp. TaxID=1974210 RepID=UPI002ACED52C|nr:polyprenyl synthetase family protein [Rhodohalobacter sp.]MDZ7757677.1 polyprenyl synthetase family protein [Rhodohalobacter sp.]
MDFLASYATLFEKQLQNLDFPSKPETLYRPQRYILKNGGKRIRPILSLISCGICGSDPQKAMPAALAVELLHNFTLIHDDIMDQADSRRGEPSVHKKWDEATAILSGDSMYTYSLLQLQNISESVDHKKISDLFLKAVNRVCEGQAMDMEFESRSDVSIEEYHQMIDGKTGALIGAAMQMGGMCGNADPDQLEKLSLIGHSLGLAFQIQDDWLDVFGDPEKFGKKKAGDIHEGKKTLLMLSALERCSDAERNVILGYIENKPLSESEVDKVIQIFKSNGIEEDTREIYLQHYSRAENALQEFGDSNYKQDLQHLIKFLKNRES